VRDGGAEQAMTGPQRGQPRAGRASDRGLAMWRWSRHPARVGNKMQAKVHAPPARLAAGPRNDTELTGPAVATRLVTEGLENARDVLS